jgi:hypothetical protein
MMNSMQFLLAIRMEGRFVCRCLAVRELLQLIAIYQHGERADSLDSQKSLTFMFQLEWEQAHSQELELQAHQKFLW